MVLDFSQRQFCEAPEGNIRLLAPAGCGKTLSLLFRCVHLTNNAKRQRPRLLIVTFTVAAKLELSARLNEDNAFSSIRDNVEITTLNSWGFRRLKGTTFSPKLITSKDDYHYTMKNVLQPIWSRYENVKQAINAKSNTTPRRIMDQIDGIKSIGFDHLRHATSEQFAGRIRELRSQGLGPKMDEILSELVKLGVLSSSVNRRGDDQAHSDDSVVYNSFFRFWCEATQHLIDSATFTLEDQKYYAYLDERNKLEDGKFLSGAAKYDHILVDEFQDINPLDLALLKAIAERNRATITIIGDDDQAIFEWRGATPEYILDPARYFGSEFATFTLSRNYRSPRNIVELSQRLIALNSRRVEKLIEPHKTDFAEIEVRATANLTDAMELVYAEVERTIGQGGSPSRMAIIGRKRSQLIPYQIYFASKDISFCAAEDLQVFMSQAFDRLLRLILIKSKCNDKQMRTQVVTDVLDMCNLVKRYPLSKTDREALRKYLGQTYKTTVKKTIDSLAEYRGTLKGGNADGKISINMADAIRHFLDASTVEESLIAIGSHFEGLQVDLGKAEDDIFFTDPPFFHLAEYATRYGNDYDQFVDDIEMAKEQLAHIPPFEDELETSSIDALWKRPIHLMTALRAKGKEFDTVILLDVNDGIWPNKNARTPEQKESERRVFYVAFTRAKKRVLMLISKQLGSREVPLSPYIKELGIDIG